MWYELHRLHILNTLGMNLGPATSLNIYYCKARSHLDYGAGITIPETHLPKLQVIQNKFLRYILHADIKTPIPCLHMMLGAPILETD